MDVNGNLKSSGIAAFVGIRDSSRQPLQAEAGKVLPPSDRVERDTVAQNLADAVSSIQTFVQSIQRNLEFSVDDSTGETVVKVVARDSGEVIRQIPSEIALKLAQSLKDADSLLFNDWA